MTQLIGGESHQIFYAYSFNIFTHQESEEKSFIYSNDSATEENI